MSQNTFITIGYNLTIFDFFVAPVYDGNNKWQATSKSLFSSAIKKHTEKDSTAIQHYAFLTGSDEIGNLGVAFFGSMCFKFLNGKFYIACLRDDIKRIDIDKSI